MTIKCIDHEPSHESHSHGQAVNKYRNRETDSNEVGDVEILVASYTELDSKVNEEEEKDAYSQNQKESSDKYCN
jgi:hypothetical protein